MSPCMAPIESPGRAQRTALAILAVTAIGLYLPALPGPLLLDDRYIIQPLLDAVTHGDSLWLYLFSESGPFGRPLAMASFILNATFAGPDLRYWKATSLAIHLLNGGLVYLTTVTLALLAATPARAARALGLATAALWLLHPLHVSTVMYLSQRMTALSTLFALAAMLLYARGRRAGADTRGGALQIVAALLLATPLANCCRNLRNWPLRIGA